MQHKRRASARPPRRGRGDVVGRERELDELLGLLDGLREGHGRAVAIVGEPGIGKTKLVATLATRARAAGMPVLSARADPPASLTVQLTATLDELARARDPASTPPGVLVTIDDLHRIRTDLIPRLEELFELTRHNPVALVVVYRERQLSRVTAATLAWATATDVLSEQRIGPLSPAAAGRLLGHPPDLDQLYRDATGNPLYLKALAAGDGMNDAGTALLGELAGLSPVQLRVAQTAAVLGEPFHPESVAAVGNLDAAATLDALDVLTRLDLVRSVDPAPSLAFRHPVLCRLIYERYEPSQRLAAHLRAEAELATRGAPLADRARQLARATHASRPEHAATLIAAARESIHTDPAAAAQWLAVAMKLVQEGDDGWYEAHLLYARTQLLCGHPWDSRELLHTLLPHASDPATVASTVVDVGRVERMLGRYAEAGALVRDGLSALSEVDHMTTAALHTELADVALDRRDHVAALRHADQAAQIAHRHGDRPAEAGALAQAATAHMFGGQVARAEATVAAASELIDATSDASVITNLPSLYLVAMSENAVERMPDAERHLLRAVALARRTGQTYILPSSLKTLGEVQLFLGRLPRARDTFDEAAHLASEGGPATRAILASMTAQTLLWLRSAGDVQDAVDMSRQAVALADNSPWGWVIFVHSTHAEVLLHAGEPDRCRQIMLDAVGGAHMPHLQVWRRPRVAEILTTAAIACGDLPAAREWSELAAADAAQVPSPRRDGLAHRARMQVLAATGSVEEAALAVQQAAAAFARASLALEVCRTLITGATRLLDKGHTAGVRQWLDRAGTLAEQCGSARLLDEVRDQRGRLASCGVPAPTPVHSLALLTDREREIATLTSTGLTSVGIARHLTVSVRTVDSHLGRIYRKLGLSNRAGLIRAILEVSHPRGGTNG